MKVFVLKSAGDDGWDLVGEYEMEQIPSIGEKILSRTDAGLHTLRVLDVQHFITGQSGAQGAFIHVEEAELYNVPAEMAEFFAS